MYVDSDMKGNTNQDDPRIYSFAKVYSEYAIR